jgi:hypothetical protein
MEDCDTNRNLHEIQQKHNNTGVKLTCDEKVEENKPDYPQYCNAITVKSLNTLSSSSSSSYSSSTTQSEEGPSNLLKPSNSLCVGSANPDTLVSPLNCLNTRRSSRGGLLDPLPPRPSSPIEKITPFLQASITNVNGISRSVEDLRQEYTTDSSSVEKDAILKIMTSSLNDVVNYVKKESKKRMEIEINEIKDELHEKNTIIDHMTGLLSTQV